MTDDKTAAPTARSIIENLEAALDMARQLGMSIESRPPPMVWALKNERAQQAEAEVQEWKRATGYSDPEALYFSLGRAGIDYHLGVLIKLRDNAVAAAEQLKSENSTAISERNVAQGERDALRETVENLGRQVGGLPLLRDVIAERDALAAERDLLNADLSERNTRLAVMELERNALAVEAERLRAALVKVDEIACRSVSAAGYGDEPPEPAGPPSPGVLEALPSGFFSGPPPSDFFSLPPPASAFAFFL